jgi:hypothetical protein
MAAIASTNPKVAIQMFDGENPVVPLKRGKWEVLPIDGVARALSFLSGPDVAAFSQVSRAAAEQIKDPIVARERMAPMVGVFMREFIEPPRADMSTHEVFQNREVCHLILDYACSDGLSRHDLVNRNIHEVFQIRELCHLILDYDADAPLSPHDLLKQTVYKRAMNAFPSKLFFGFFGGINYFDLPEIDLSRRVVPEVVSLATKQADAVAGMRESGHSDEEISEVMSAVAGDHQLWLNSLLFPHDLVDRHGKRFPVMRWNVADGSKLVVLTTQTEREGDGEICWRVHAIGVQRCAHFKGKFEKRICNWDVSSISTYPNEFRQGLKIRWDKLTRSRVVGPVLIRNLLVKLLEDCMTYQPMPSAGSSSQAK